MERKRLMWSVVVVVLMVRLQTVEAAAGLRSDFKWACPSERKFCVHRTDLRDKSGTPEIIKYTRYDRSQFEFRSAAVSQIVKDAYVEGWDQSRQINSPYDNFRPDTPSFVYTDLNQLCLLNPDNKIICSSKNIAQDPFLSNNSFTNTQLFITTAKNPRNNNVSLPAVFGDKQMWARLDAADIKTSVTVQDGRYSYEWFAHISNCIITPADPEPQFVTYTEWPLALVYIVYSLCIFLLVLWYFINSMAANNANDKTPLSTGMDNATVELEDGKKNLTEHRQGPETPILGQHRSSSVTKKGEVISVVVRKEDVDLQSGQMDIKQIGYKETLIGNLLLGYFALLTAGLNLPLIITIMDYYGKFKPYLFGGGEKLLTAFIIVWLFATVWFMMVVIFQTKIRNFFRTKTSLRTCTKVHMFKPEYTEILLADRSGVSDFVAKIESFLFPKAQAGYEETVDVEIVRNKDGEQFRVLEFQHLRYIYSVEIDRFVPGVLSLGETYADIEKESDGLTDEEHIERMNSVGPNAIEVEMPSMGVSLVQEFFSFFYIYQIMCYYVWFYFDYMNLAIVMTIVVISSACINILTKRTMQASVVKMTHYRSKVNVQRSGVWKEVESPDLVPGDLVRVEENWILPCDLIIVKGATVCDESMLTGESMPVQKFPIPEDNHDVYEANGSGKKHTLFSGTKVLSSGRNEEILALVESTGAHTSKGQLIQSILFPVPMRFKYDEHLKVVLAFLLTYGLIACYFVVKFLNDNGNLDNRLNAWAYCIFMLSAILSPLLPVVITVGQVNAAKRLEKLGVFTLNSQRITLSGKIRVFCFDKTGTLTKEGLDFLGCKPIVKETTAFSGVVEDVTQSELLSKEMQFALASCHAVGSLNGELVGNQVEVKMFSATKWDLVEEEGKAPMIRDPTRTHELEVVKRYEFDHHRMSMSVVMREKSTGELYVFCKGSYEKIQSLSLPESTPSDYQTASEGLAREGCYVLGIAWKKLAPLSDAELTAFVKNRDEVEANLSLLGNILFRNELKPDTHDAIVELIKGDTRCVMITGDNAMCGCYIARKCGMVAKDSRVILGDMVTEDTRKVLQWSNVDTLQRHSLEEIQEMVSDAVNNDVELALTGKAFDYLIQMGQMEKLLYSVRIFSRMTPNGKVQCVQMHMDSGAVTGMCGDGGNDCGALRVAHAGIALSDAEASVVAPFTSKPKTITSVVDLCREGRCSVATSFASVKMLVMYGFVASTLRFVQYFNAVIMSEWCYVIADGFILVGLSYVITLSRPLPTLGDQRPTSSLVGPTTVFSIMGQELINVIFLYFGIRHLTHQDWYCPFTPDNIDLSKWWLLSDNALTTCLFYSVIFQQQTAALVFSFGSRYRLPIWRNYALVVFFIAVLAFNVYLLLGEPNVIHDRFRIASSTNVVGLPDIPLSFKFRSEYLAFVLGNMGAVFIYEYFFILGPVRDFFRKRFHKDALPMKL